MVGRIELEAAGIRRLPLQQGVPHAHFMLRGNSSQMDEQYKRFHVFSYPGIRLGPPQIVVQWFELEHWQQAKPEISEGCHATKELDQGSISCTVCILL